MLYLPVWYPIALALVKSLTTCDKVCPIPRTSGRYALREYPRALEIALELLDLPAGAKVIISALSLLLYRCIETQRVCAPSLQMSILRVRTIHPNVCAELLPLRPAGWLSIILWDLSLISRLFRSSGFRSSRIYLQPSVLIPVSSVWWQLWEICHRRL